MKRLTLVAALVLAGCSTAPPYEESVSQPQPHSIPQPQPQPPARGGYYKDDGPHDNPPANLAQVPDAVPKAEPLHRYANRPYTVFGRDYVPLARLEPFRQRGLASWYGKRFHGQKTASGETYDMYAMTAAHPTLPIPSYARVTHVGNGRSVVVRVNDRGPFHPGRIIDLSYAAASKLGYIQAGSAQVEVESLLTEQKSAAEQKSVYLQVGAFSSRENAENLRVRVAQELAWLKDTLQVLLAGNLWRLHVGPYGSPEDARSVAERIEAQLQLRPLVVVR
ncbi:MAG: septal ring lytic transglycosylase RlpA family protein [Burkholderiales bacterium]